MVCLPELKQLFNIISTLPFDINDIQSLNQFYTSKNYCASSYLGVSSRERKLSAGVPWALASATALESLWARNLSAGLPSDLAAEI